MNKTGILVLALMLLPLSAMAQSPAITNFSADAVAARYPAYSATFEVRLPNGEPLDTLKAADVSVHEGSAPVSGTLVRGNPGGVAWVLVLDTSGSMSPRLEEVKEGLRSFVGAMRPQDRVALVVFNDDVTVVQSLTADHAAIESAISRVAVAGRTTELYFAVNEAAKLLSEPGVPARHMLAVVSDGKDEGAAYTLDDTVRRATEVSASIAALAIGGGDSKYLRNLQRMAELTGGYYIPVNPGDSWEQKLELLPRFVEARYRFSWQSRLPRDARSHEIQLRIALGTTVLSRPISVTTPIDVAAEQRRLAKRRAAAEAASVRRRRFLYGGGGLVAAVAGLTVFLLTRLNRRRRAQERTELEDRLEAERRSKAELHHEMEKGISDLRGKLVTLEEKLPASVSTLPSQKRRTVYSSGHEEHAATAYRHAAVQVLEGPLEGSRFTLLTSTSFGRDDDNHVVLEDQRVSLHHARIINDRGTWWLEDLGSTNGTYVDGQRVAVKHPLAHGQTVRIGAAQLLFVGEA